MGKALFIISLLLFPLSGLYSDVNIGSYEKPIIDSDMSLEQALQGISPECPQYIKDKLCLITVKYFSFDGRIHQGQLVIDIDLIDDIVFAFEETAFGMTTPQWKRITPHVLITRKLQADKLFLCTLTAGQLTLIRFKTHI